MPILSCYVDDRTIDLLKRACEETGNTVEELAESAIEEQALGWLRDNPERNDR